MKEAKKQVWARIGEDQVKRLNIRCAELGVKRPAGVARAITEWLQTDKPQSIPGGGAGTGTEQTIPPATQDSAPPPPDIHDGEWRERVPQEIRNWLDLVERAVTVRNAKWRDMLASIQTQLNLVAGAADDETGPDGSGAQQQSSERVQETGGHGTGATPATVRNRAKTG